MGRAARGPAGHRRRTTEALPRDPRAVQGAVCDRVPHRAAEEPDRESPAARARPAARLGCLRHAVPADDLAGAVRPARWRVLVVHSATIAILLGGVASYYDSSSGFTALIGFGGKQAASVV